MEQGERSSVFDLEYELFAAYKVSIEYPSGWEIQVKKLKLAQGDVVFKNDKEGFTCTLLWGPLKEVKKKFTSAKEQAQRVLEGFEEKKRVKNFKLIEQRSLMINGHDASLIHMRMIIRYGGLIIKTWLHSDVYAFYLHCDESDRYFILYALSPPEQEEKHSKIFNHMIETFKCH